MRNPFITNPGKTLLLLVLTAMLWSAGAADSERAIVIRTATVKAAPSFGARTITVLPAGSAVRLGTRVGGWQKVTILPEARQSGWLRTYQVRTHINSNESVIKNRQSERGVLSGLSSLSSATAGLFGQREMEGGSGSMTATMGVRGLSEADLENARPNSEELALLKRNSTGSKNARKFAQAGKLKAQKVKDLPEPKKSREKR